MDLKEKRSGWWHEFFHCFGFQFYLWICLSAWMGEICPIWFLLFLYFFKSLACMPLLLNLYIFVYIPYVLALSIPFDLWMVQGVFCLSPLWSIRGLICRSVSSVNVLTCGESRRVNDTIFLSEISLGLGFDEEARQLSSSRNRRPDSNGTPEEEQPITIIAPASDYLSVI